MSIEFQNSKLNNKLFLQCYACDPRYGSERGMGARNAIEIVKYFKEVILITEKGNEGGLTEYFPENVKIKYLDIGEKYRNYCWRQGDWRFYIGYRKWLRKSFKFISKSCTTEDYAWQISMVGFREPGYLYKLPCKTILGPISGFRSIPESAFKYLTLINRLGWRLKKYINFYQQNSKRVTKGLSNYDCVFCVTNYDMNIVKKNNNQVCQIAETGSYKRSTKLKFKGLRNSTFKFLFVGKIVERKGLFIALQAFRVLENKLPYEIIVVGDGPQLKSLKREFIDLPIKFAGNIRMEETNKYYETADYFIHPSLQDATSSVYMEAISFGLPVLSFDINGPGETNLLHSVPVASTKGDLIKEYAILIDRMMLMSDSEYFDIRERLYDISSKYSWQSNIYEGIQFIKSIN